MPLKGVTYSPTKILNKFANELKREKWNSVQKRLLHPIQQFHKPTAKNSKFTQGVRNAAQGRHLFTYKNIK